MYLTKSTEKFHFLSCYLFLNTRIARYLTEVMSETLGIQLIIKLSSDKYIIITLIYVDPELRLLATYLPFYYFLLHTGVIILSYFLLCYFMVGILDTN